MVDVAKGFQSQGGMNNFVRYQFFNRGQFRDRLTSLVGNRD